MTEKDRKMFTFFMKSALLSAENSYSRRAKVGAVLVKDNRIICNSWNGTPPGCDNNCEVQNPDGTLSTNKFVVHAEANIIAFSAKYFEIQTLGTKMFVTLSPCMSCSLLILQAGIKEVYYYKPYRDTEGISFLNSKGVKCVQFGEEDFYKEGKTFNDYNIGKHIRRSIQRSSEKASRGSRLHN